MADTFNRLCHCDLDYSIIFPMEYKLVFPFAKQHLKTQKTTTMTLLRRTSNPAWTGIFDDAFFKDFFDVTPKAFGNVAKSVPAVNVKETDNSYKVELAAPGVKKDDFRISVDENVLTISSEAKAESEEKDKDGRYTKREFSYQSFSRSFTLDPDHVEVDAIAATYEDGVLHLEIPKKSKEEVKVKKTIEVK